MRRSAGVGTLFSETAVAMNVEVVEKLPLSLFMRTEGVLLLSLDEKWYRTIDTM
jgi:hypothetical protein